MPDKNPLEFNPDKYNKTLQKTYQQSLASLASGDIVRLGESQDLFKNLETFRNDTSLNEKLKASDQSTFAQLGNSVVQSLTTIGGTTIDMLGQLTVGLPYALKAALSSETFDFHNFISDAGKQVTDWGRNEFPIYRENPNKVGLDLADPAYWLSHVPDIANTASFLIGGKGVVFGASKLLKGLGLGQKLEALSPLAKGLITAGSEAGVMRYTENMMEGVDVYDQTKKEVLDELSKNPNYFKNLPNKTKEEIQNEGIDLNDNEKVAEWLASSAAWKSFRVNSLNYVFDFMQTASMMKALKTSGSVLGKSIPTAKAQFESLGKKFTKADYAQNILYRSGRAIWQQGNEGIEEAINYIGTQEGLHYGKYLTGKETEEGGNIKDYLKAPELWESAFWGTVGGVIGGKGIEKGLEAIRNKGKLFNPDEVDEIKARNLSDVALKSNLTKLDSNINPYTNEKLEGDEKEIELQKTTIKKDLIADLAGQMANRAYRTKNISLLQDWLNDDNTVQKFVDSGLGTKDEAKTVLKTMSDTVKDFDMFYKKNQTDLRFSNIKNNALKDLIVYNAYISKQEQEKFKGQYEFYEARKTKLLEEDETFKGLTEADKNQLRQDLDNLSKFITLEELADYKLAKKKEYKNIESISRALDARYNELKKNYDTSLKEVNKQEIESRLDKHLENNLNGDIIKSYINSNVYKEIGQIKSAETSSILNDKKSHKDLERKVEQAGKEEKIKLDREYSVKIDSLVKETIKGINQTDKSEAEIERLINFYFKPALEKIKQEDRFKLTDINLDDVNIHLRTQINKNVKTVDTEVKDEKVEFPFNGDVLEEEEFWSTHIGKETSDILKTSDTQVLKDLEKEITSLHTTREEDDIVGKAEDRAVVKRIRELLEQEKSQEELLLEEMPVLNNSLKLAEASKILNQTSGNENATDVLNTYLRDGIQVNPTFDEKGDTVLDIKEAHKLELIMNLKQGTKILIDNANRNDFKSEKDYENYYVNYGETGIVGRIRTENGLEQVLFINSGTYLEEEYLMTAELQNNVGTDDFLELFDLLQVNKDVNVDKKIKQSNLKKLENNKLFLTLYPYSFEDEVKLTDAISHLNNVLYFGLSKNPNTNKYEYNKDFLNNSLNDWHLKIQRDYLNQRKIAEKLIKEGPFTTEVAYASSGSIVVSQNEEGEVKLRNLRETLDNIVLLTRDKNAPNILKKAVKSNTEWNGKTDVIKSGLIFAAINTGEGNQIPTRLTQNTLKSKKDSKVNKAHIDFVIEKTKNILQLLNQTESYDQNTLEVKFLKKQLSDLIVVNKNLGDAKTYFKIHSPNTKNEQQLDAHVEYKNAEGKKCLLYYNNNFNKFGLYIDDVRQDIDKLEESLEGLTRNFKDELLYENAPYVDTVTGEEYLTYQDYLIDTEALLTYVGKVKASDGTEIGNFQVKSNGFDSRPLIVNISTNFQKVAKKDKAKNSKDLLDELNQSEFKIVLDKAVELKVEIEDKFRKPDEIAQEMGGLDSQGVVYFTDLINSSPARRIETTVHELLHGIIRNHPNKSKYKERIVKYNKDLIELINKVKENEFGNEYFNSLQLDEQTKNQIKLLIANSEVIQILNKIDSTNENYQEQEFEETINYAFTNRNFAELLNILPSDKGINKTQKKTFWQRLKNIIQDMLENIFPNSKLDELTQLLDDIFTSTKSGESTTETKKETRTDVGEQKDGNIQDTTIDEEDEYLNLFNNITYEPKAIPLTDNTKNLYERYRLLNDKGGIKVLNGVNTTSWLETLNKSPYYIFKLRNTIGGKRILIFPKEENVSNILDNANRITDEEVQNRIKKCL